MQKYSSANTSVNANKLPKIYTLAADKIKGKKVIDYGCGKYFDNYLSKVDAELYGYDKYNRDDQAVLQGSYDIAICSNVLNVIAEREVRLDVLRELARLAPLVLIKVYEGDRSGVGKVTKTDCYQLNWSRGNYIPELVAVFGAGNVTWCHGYFECRRAAESEVA